MYFLVQDLIHHPHERKRWYIRLPTLRTMVIEAISYFSVWSLLYPILTTVHSNTSLYNASLCSVGGAYLTWVYPRTIPVHYLRLNLVYPETVVMDLLAHQLPFWNSCKRGIRCHEEEDTFSFLTWLQTRWMVLLYTACVGVEGTKIKYHVRDLDILLILVLAEIVFWFNNCW